MMKYLLIPFLLIFSSLTFAQNQELLMIQNDTSQIILQSMDINVRVIGNIATTITEMTFYNPNDRVLEGELNFPLAENQNVYRFALDINGKLREAVAVEKNLGRRAFEGVVRQNIDPALLEMTAGNNYKARIYPIPAKGTRRILIGVEEELHHSTAPLYQLAMNHGVISRFRIKLEVVGSTEKPEIKQNDLTNFDFEKWNQAFIAEYSEKNFKADGTLSFEIPTKLNEVVYRESYADTDFFYLSVDPKGATINKKRPEKVAIVWDASNSARKRNLAKEKELISTYLKQLGQVEVTILKYSDQVHEPIKLKVKNGDANDILTILDTTIYDGGTDMGKIKLEQLEADEILLFTDGIANLGRLVVDEVRTPVYTICSSNTADLSLLKYIANGTGGAFLNLMNTSVEAARQQLQTQVLQFLGASFNERKISEIYPSQPKAIVPNRAFTLSGKMKPGVKAAITLKFGAGGKVLETREVLVDKSFEGAGLRRLWANKLVDELTSGPDKNREAIIAVGKEYNLVTPHTSLIVLDRVEDYVRYNILPPEELKKEYNRLVAERVEETRLRKDDIIELVLEDFEDRVDWWENNKKDPNKHIPKNDERRPNQNSQGQVENENSENTKEAQTSSVENRVAEADNSESSQQEMQSTTTVITNPIDRGDYDKVVSGKVTSAEDGSVLPGVNVVVKGTTRGTVADIDGNYQIAMNDDEELVISFIGLTTQEVQVGGIEVVDLSMVSDVRQLSEVVVTAMGVETNRQSLSYAVSTVTTTLKGKVAGVNISDAAGGTVIIRGNSSIAVGDEPLYMIDGEMVTKSDFEVLDLDQVASMNVIKDENATALYGSRGADGVIVITTKDALEDELVLPDSISSRFEKDLVIDDWQPDEPYLDSLMKAEPLQRYSVYLDLKETYATMPSFYLSVGSYFLNEGQEVLGMRILSNLVELDLENYELLKILAHKYRQLGAYQSSIHLFENIAEIREGEPHSLRDMALTYQASGRYQQALDLFYEIITTEWRDDDDRFPLLKSTVLGEMNNLIALHRKELNLDRIPKRLIRPMPVDIRVVLDWNTLETDLDLWVIEPNGEKCYYGNMLSVNGGHFVEDYTEGYGPEEYLLKNAISGEYQIEVDYYDDRVQKIAGPTTLQVTIFTNYGRKNQQERSMTLQLKNEEETVKVGSFVWEG